MSTTETNAVLKTEIEHGHFSSVKGRIDTAIDKGYSSDGSTEKKTKSNNKQHVAILLPTKNDGYDKAIKALKSTTQTVLIIDEVHTILSNLEGHHGGSATQLPGFIKALHTVSNSVTRFGFSATPLEFIEYGDHVKISGMKMLAQLFHNTESPNVMDSLQGTLLKNRVIVVGYDVSNTHYFPNRYMGAVKSTEALTKVLNPSYDRLLKVVNAKNERTPFLLTPVTNGADKSVHTHLKHLAEGSHDKKTIVDSTHSTFSARMVSFNDAQRSKAAPGVHASHHEQYVGVVSSRLVGLDVRGVSTHMVLGLPRSIAMLDQALGRSFRFKVNPDDKDVFLRTVVVVLPDSEKIITKYKESSYLHSCEEMIKHMDLTNAHSVPDGDASAKWNMQVMREIIAEVLKPNLPSIANAWEWLKEEDSSIIFKEKKTVVEQIDDGLSHASKRAVRFSSYDDYESQNGPTSAIHERHRSTSGFGIFDRYNPSSVVARGVAGLQYSVGLDDEDYDDEVAALVNLVDSFRSVPHLDNFYELPPHEREEYLEFLREQIERVPHILEAIDQLLAKAGDPDATSRLSMSQRT